MATDATQFTPVHFRLNIEIRFSSSSQFADFFIYATYCVCVKPHFPGGGGPDSMFE
jgi:hypothetical protein